MDVAKIMLIGYIGKTSLVTRFCQDTFRDTIREEEEIDITRKEVDIDGCEYLVDILDVSGSMDYAEERHTWSTNQEVCRF